MTYHTHNDFHLGDNLVVLNFLRRLALAHPGESFVHAAHECHLDQLMPVVADVPNVRLCRIEDRAPESRDVWKNAGAGTDGGGYWERHPDRNQFVPFHLAWFRDLAAAMGLESPVATATDLLFDYPELPDAKPTVTSAPFDFLIINSRPCSGQFMAYSDLYCLDPLIERLSHRHLCLVTQESKVPNIHCTRDHGATISSIGRLSLQCKYILAVATGPMWPTFNKWNQDSVQLRLILLEGERLDGLSPNIEHASTISAAERVLVERELI